MKILACLLFMCTIPPLIWCTKPGKQKIYWDYTPPIPGCLWGLEEGDAYNTGTISKCQIMCNGKSWCRSLYYVEDHDLCYLSKYTKISNPDSWKGVCKNWANPNHYRSAKYYAKIIHVTEWTQKSGADCWYKCGQKGGSCSTFCGSDGYCCRKGYADCPVGAAEASPKHHTCVEKIGEKIVDDLTRYGELCTNPCANHGENYLWCNTKATAAGWDYCSANDMSTRYAEACKEPCSKKGANYFWCNKKSGGWDYCSPA